MIPSLLQIPSAVSDSKLHSVLPNNGKGDFTFDRSTGATRINRDGLIEEVGYFSSELVQNGNFSELGSELVTNGDFETNSDWTLGTGWSINNGKAVAENATTTCQQDVSFTSGKTYKVVFTVSDYESGTVRAQFTGGGSTNATARSANGTYTEYIVAGASHTKFRLQGLGGGFTGKIDNVSVKQVDPNDRWTVTNATSDNYVEFGDGEARIVLGTTSPLTLFQNSGTFKAGKQYKLVVDIKTVTSGAIKIDGAGISEVFNTAGATTRIINPTTNSNIIFYRSSVPADITLNSVSLVEVLGDRPRLSYDITNGVVEDQPHLLLEPSSTNLHIFSTQSSQWTKSNWTTTDNYAISPDGTKNAFRAVSSTNNALLYISGAGSSGINTVSVYAKSNTGTNQKFRFFANGTNTISSDFTVTNEWTRFEYSYTYSAVTAGIYGASSELSDILFFGFQHEVNPYATSYIPTAGTVISRASETCNNSKPSVNSTEGVLYCEIAALADDGTNRTIGLLGDSNNFIELAYRDSSNTIRGLIKTSGAVEANIQHTLSDSTSFNKIACKYKANDVSLYVNGQQVGVDTSASMPSNLNEINFYRFDATEDFYGKVKGVAVYNEALSESQLMQLTGVTASSIYSNFVTRTASFTVEALNEVKKVIDNL